MIAMDLKFKSDGITRNDEEARMLIPEAVEGAVPVLSAVWSVR